MEKTTPVRKSHTSTSDLLTWSESPSLQASNSSAPSSRVRSHQPSESISKVLFGGQITEEEAESLMKRKQCSGPKFKEMTGSGIFATEDENGNAEFGGPGTLNNKTGLRVYQQTVNAMSHISFGAEESVSPKKATSIAEVAKQRELSGTLENESELNSRKQLSVAKCKELSGHDIFGPPPEIVPRSVVARSLAKESKDMDEPAPRTKHTSVKVSSPAGGQSNIMFSDTTPVKTTRKIHDQKFAELTGNDIFKEEAPPGSAEKPLSIAKLREMTGSDIFSDGKLEARDSLGGVRKPPGGESSIALV